MAEVPATEICGVRFPGDAGLKLLWSKHSVHPGDIVVVADEQGEHLGRVVVGTGQVLESVDLSNLGSVTRLAGSGELPAEGLDSSALVQLPPDWGGWMVQPGDSPAVQDEADAQHFAHELLEKVFNGAHSSGESEGNDS